ncbi:MAG: hypothetical protein A2X64_07815 [Ignavibacteria bacterium GWF2_33_9]|nr:MAG: hypothetical protein A2X64_07815 [Ignavibacteria bacterium GWF2_33_9]
MTILRAENIYKQYKNKSHEMTQVLKGLNFEVNKGDFISIKGASGSGKSTLLHILGGLDKPDEGNVQFLFNSHFTQLYSLSDKVLSNVRNQTFGFVFQFHHLLPEFSALENTMMPALIAAQDRKFVENHAKEMLIKVGLEEKFNSKPSNLSGGEQQRVAIVRALINNPEIIFADEPTGNLDSENSIIFLDIIDKLISEYKTTFVIATHSDEIASRAAKRYILQNGILN